MIKATKNTLASLRQAISAFTTRSLPPALSAPSAPDEHELNLGCEGLTHMSMEPFSPAPPIPKAPDA